MVNPRWRPEIANSRVPLKGASNMTKTVKHTLPQAGEYIGTYIDIFPYCQHHHLSWHLQLFVNCFALFFVSLIQLLTDPLISFLYNISCCGDLIN